MVLVDTSVWVDHLRRGSTDLAILLRDGHVTTHDFVIGELACGNLKSRPKFLGLISALPVAKTAEHEEVMTLIENRKLMGKGIGWVDAHVLASALISGLLIWTRDRSLADVSASAGCIFDVGR